jgi:hypothetical protein
LGRSPSTSPWSSRLILYRKALHTGHNSNSFTPHRGRGCSH